MSMSKLLVIVAALSAVALVAVLGHACTEFRVRAQDGTVVIGRSMEFAVDLEWTLEVQTRGATHTALAPNHRAGLTWKDTYGYIYIDSMDQGQACDGMNEVGLSVSTLSLPESTYQDVPHEQYNPAISQAELPAFLLGTCATVDDVRAAIADVYVWGRRLSEFPLLYGVHYGVYDASGRGLVIEYMDGAPHLHDNTLGVMTNSPSYDWHLLNVARYLYLNPFNPRPLTLGDVHPIERSGFGAGLLGLPGDPTPPSRFVRTFAMTHFAHPPATQTETVVLAQHILNVVDIPIGVARDYLESEVVYEHPYWVVLRDLTHGILYVRNHDDLGFYAVDTKRLDFGGSGYQSIAIGDLRVESVDYTHRFVPNMHPVSDLDS